LTADPNKGSEKKIIVHTRDVDFELDAAGTREFYQPKLTGTTNERYTGSGYTPVTTTTIAVKTTGNKVEADKPAASRINETDETPVPPNNMITVDNINKLNVTQLKAELRRHGDKISGNKLALRKRLKEAMRKPDVSTKPAEIPLKKGEEALKPEGALLSEFIEEQLFYQGYAFLASGEGGEINSGGDSDGNCDNSDSDTQDKVIAHRDRSRLEEDTHETAPQLARHVKTPESYKQAMRLPERCKWQQAMDRELASLREMDVFKVVARPANHPVIATRWTMRLHFGWPPVHQMDVDTAFLYAKLQELVYCEPPWGLHKAPLILVYSYSAKEDDSSAS
jgi:hypothetical protein